MTPLQPLSYNPVAGDAAATMRDHDPRQVLVVGAVVPEGPATAELRILSDPDVLLPAGVYLFGSDEGSSLMIVDEGGPPAGWIESDWSAHDDHPLVRAYGWFGGWWERATKVPAPRFSVGDEALTAPEGQEAVIRRRRFQDGSWWYSVRVEGRTVDRREAQLQPPDVDDDPTAWIEGEAAPATRFAATLTRAKLREQLTDTVYSFRATRTVFRPYQFRPIMRLLESGQLRLLIADEVGLGKTIEAGLVWTELDARGLANRVLVVCPSMLVPKWQAEMDTRFGFDLIELARPDLDDLLDRVETDRLGSRFHGVCSLERLRVWKGLDRLAELSPHFDVVIVDEAHALRNTGTRSHALGALLSDWADALVFLSATPLNLGNDDLYNLLELLAPGEFDDRLVLEQRLEPNAVLNGVSASLFDRTIDNTERLRRLDLINDMAFGPAVTVRPEFPALRRLLSEPALTAPAIAEAKRLISRLHALSAVVTRARKVEVQEHKAVREAQQVDVSWTEAEYAFYNAFERWQVARARRLALPVGFVTQMPRRLASTCLPAAASKVLGRGAQDWQAAVESEEPLDDLVPEGDGELDFDDEVDLESPPPEVRRLAEALGSVDSKFDAFLAALLPVVADGRRVLVFTFSRAALRYLHGRLRGRARVAALHGGMGKDERQVVMTRFREGAYDVLLATRVASEGLDFEFCSAVVNYDLPWNPMEVEQRIGRIDRIGQVEEKIVVVSFHTPGTIETDIVERVLTRIGVFESSIGELEPILQSRLGDLRRAMFDFRLTEDERERRIEEVMAAVEEQRLTRQDLETASSYLSSTDAAEIDGFEQDLLASGRYVGQPELVLLLEDWIATSEGGSCRRSADGTRVSIRGTQGMERHLLDVRAAGERSAAEIEHLARSLRNEDDILLCLDQELARTTGGELLSAGHPLTRAALRVPGAKQARFAHLRAVGPRPGTFLVVLGVARWKGVRPAAELWAAATDLSSGADAPSEVGLSLLAGLAEGGLSQGLPPAGDLPRALDRAERQLRRRQQREEEERLLLNRALTEARRISLRETHTRKVGQIERRIATIRASNRLGVLGLHQAQLAKQDQLLRQREEELDRAAVGALDVEHVAVCTLEVQPA